MGKPVRRVVVVMGVSGAGKTTVGRLLAEELGVPYGEADDFHPRANIAKMSAGVPLDDDDRAPWLDVIAAWAREHTDTGGVVSCSALKRRYRDRLRAMAPGLVFVHLRGGREVIARRLAVRKGHFMPSALLDSQLAALEPLGDDEDGIIAEIVADPRTIARQVAQKLRAGDTHRVRSTK